MQRILITPSFAEYFPIVQKLITIQEVTLQPCPPTSRLLLSCKNQPCYYRQKMLGCIKSVVLKCYSGIPWCSISMNISFLKNNLVATDHWSVHKLLRQRTETRTEWPKFHHYQTAPFNLVSSLPSRKVWKSYDSDTYE